MKITKQGENLIVTIPLWQEGNYQYSEGKWKVPNCVGVIAGDEMTISHMIYLDYKNTNAVQEGMPIIHFSGEKEEFIKLCKELELDIWTHEICAYCGKPIYGSFTVGDKGNMCMDCSYKEDEKNN